MINNHLQLEDGCKNKELPGVLVITRTHLETYHQEQQKKTGGNNDIKQVIYHDYLPNGVRGITLLDLES
jgi:hypothetical protein